MGQPPLTIPPRTRPDFRNDGGAAVATAWATSSLGGDGVTALLIEKQRR
jgi:hypothetical protein